MNTNSFFDRACFNYEQINSATFSISNPLKLLRGSGHILKGVRQSQKIIRSFDPDIVVGFGSFYTLPLLVAAKLQNIPIVLHEQNAIPGKVNRLFSRFAHTTAITFPETANMLQGNARHVRFPIRPRLEDEDPWSYFGLEKGRLTLLVFGGSQGARRLNELFVEALPQLSGFQVLHFTGNFPVGDIYQKLGIPHCVKAFEPKIHLAMQIADLAVTRAGAGTIAELIEYETPAILIPFPFAAENHQEKNAMHFPGGATYLESALTAEKLAKAILSFPIEEKKQDLQQYKKSCYHDSLTEVIKELITD